MPSPRPGTLHLRPEQTLNILNAIQFAESIGRPLNLALTVLFSTLNKPLDHSAARKKIIGAVSSALERLGCPSLHTHIYWLENCPSGGYGAHIHLGLHLPDHLNSPETHAKLQRCLSLAHGQPAPGDPRNPVKVKPLWFAGGWARYMCKGLDPEALSPEQRAILTQKGVTFTPQGRITARKRAGCSHDIDANARKAAGWQEVGLEALPDQNRIEAVARTIRTLKLKTAPWNLVTTDERNAQIRAKMAAYYRTLATSPAASSSQDQSANSDIENPQVQDAEITSENAKTIHVFALPGSIPEAIFIPADLRKTMSMSVFSPYRPGRWSRGPPAPVNLFPLHRTPQFSMSPIRRFPWFAPEEQHNSHPQHNRSVGSPQAFLELL